MPLLLAHRQLLLLCLPQASLLCEHGEGGRSLCLSSSSKDISPIGLEPDPGPPLHYHPVIGPVANAVTLGVRLHNH